MSQDSNTSAEKITWDLRDLYASAKDPQLERDQQEAEQQAEEIAGKYHGRIGTLTPQELLDLIRQYEGLLDRSGRVSTYAFLDWSTNTEDPARGALLQKVTEHNSALQQKLLFLELEWAHTPDDRAESLMTDPLLHHHQYWLRLARRYRPHLLSEAEEKILAEKTVTGRSAWNRFFEEVMSAERYELDGARLQQQSILSKLYEPDRELRRRAAASFTEGLKAKSRITTFIFNNILADKSSDDRLRAFSSWISARNLDNQIEDATVEALIQAVTSRYDIVSRYYRLKGRLLDLPELYEYDRYAPLPAVTRTYHWQEARELVLSSYDAFHPRMKEIAELFFQKRWIDAAVRPGKRGGAYSHGAVPSVHPYIFLNYEGTPRDVMTLAHELGHGVHQFLSREQGILLAHTPLTTAETASVFGEMLVFNKLLAQEQDPRIRLSLLVQTIEDAFATVFRQIAMNRFEEAIHNARRSEGELTGQRFSELWLETQRAMFGDSLTMSEDYGLWWSYIPHFIHTPGYVYAYAFGQLLVLALYARYREMGGGFPERYLDLLQAGGSDWPEKLVKPLGVDLKDSQFWARGLGMIEDLVKQAEELAG